MLFLISSCVVLTLDVSSVVLSDLDKWRKDELLIKWFPSIKLDQSFYCLKPQTALQSFNFPCNPVIPGSNLNNHSSSEDHVFVHTKPAEAVKLPLNPRKPVHNIQGIPWQVCLQPNCWESSCIFWSWTCCLQAPSNALPPLGKRDDELLSLAHFLHVILDLCQTIPFPSLPFCYCSWAQQSCPWRWQATSPNIPVRETQASWGMLFSTPRMDSKKLSCIRKTMRFKGSFTQIVLLECEASHPAKYFSQGIYRAVLQQSKVLLYVISC